ncbi:MAG: IS630 family transposase [Pseudomonadota bacterium]
MAHPSPRRVLAAENPPGASEGVAQSPRGLRKKGLLQALSAARTAHPTKRITLWFQDEMRVGQKGRLCHRWWCRGQRPSGRQDQCFDWTYLFGAVRPDGEGAFALVLPIVDTAMMQLFLDRFAATLAPDEHAVMVLDKAGWHGAGALRVPGNVTLGTLPSYSPQLYPMDRVWLYLRERHLSLRVFPNQNAIVDACCNAWNALAADTARLRSLCLQPWIERVI